MSPHEKASLIIHLERAWEAAHMLPTTTPCNACVHHAQGVCRRWNDTIPADTLPNGCDEFFFNYNSVPF